MAAIYMDNIVKPRLANNPTTAVSKDPSLVSSYIYTDLHLDLEAEQNIGTSLLAQKTSDIKVDNDERAIRNSIFNIFTTRPGQKILNPRFGSALDQYLFSPITDFRAKLIGEKILEDLKLEPRITVLNVSVTPDPDLNQYQILLIYKLTNDNIARNINFNINNSYSNNSIITI
jgi:phage baseplate assembly protein W